MNYSNTIDTLTAIIDSHGFESTLVSYNFPVEITTATKGNIRTFSEDSVVRQGIASAIGGNKSIVFAENISEEDAILKRFIRSFCVIVTTTPPPIVLPTIFTRQLSDLADDINTATLVSSKSLLPVVVYMGGTTLFDYTKVVSTSSAHERVILPPWVKALDKSISREDFSRSLALADEILSATFPQWVEGILGGTAVSSSSSEGSFVRFATPHSIAKTCQLINDKASDSSILDKDYDYITALLYQSSFKKRMNTTTTNTSDTSKNYLCTGCPFMEISQSIGKNDVMYTNINCPDVIRFFGMHFVSLREFSSLAETSVDPSSMVFVDHVHNYSLGDNPLLGSGGIVYLNTMGLDNKTFKPFSSSALKSNKKHLGALLFPYSCHNIPADKPKKVVAKRCKCMANGAEPHCILNTGCPALTMQDGKANIFTNMCTGCNGCKIACPYGAI